MRRLTIQADVLRTEPRRWLFERAGLAPAMRILEGAPVPAVFDPTTFGDRVCAQILARRGSLRIQRVIQAWARIPGGDGSTPPSEDRQAKTS